MGLIKAGAGAVGGVLADQWKEFFYCDALDKTVLMVKGEKRVSGRSSNTKGSDNIISNGSGIAVADGQCMLIVDQGKIVEVCAEPGEFTYDTSTEPSIFTGKLSEGIRETFKTIGKRFTYGGDTGKDQRVYYINTKELIDNKFGSPSPIPFRIVDRNIGLDIDAAIRCSGIYSYRITNPLLFYTNVCSNVEKEFLREELDKQLKTEFISALQPALAKISEMEVRPSALPAHTEELSSAMNAALTQKWSDLRGISVVSIALNPIILAEEYEEIIRRAQSESIYRSSSMRAAAMTGATADAMRSAAENPGGAFMGYMGMGMVQQQAGGMQGVFDAADREEAARMAQTQQTQQAQTQAADAWNCSCGAVATGKFCPNCGSPKPQANGWVCADCQTNNTGNFCQNCGKPKPAANQVKHCSNCGWQVPDPSQAPKFCPECGTPF